MARIVSFSIAIMISLLQGCTSRSSTISEPVLNQLDDRPAIIFIPGFYGSVLKEKKTGRRVFLTGMEALFGSSALSLFQNELGTPVGPELEVGGVLGSVPVIPGIFEIEVFSEFFNRLRSERPDAQVLALPYDWRDDLFLAVEKLDALVKLLASKNCKEINIVGFSMGGLVTSYYLGYGAQPPESAKINWSGAQLINKVVFLGTPFGGTMISFYTFDKGSGLTRAERLMPADTISSFPSMYQTLPSVGTFLTKAGEKIVLDLFDPEVWKKNKFGLLRRQNLNPTLMEARENFTRESLLRSKKFAELVQLGRTNVWPPPATLKVLNVVGTGRETLNSGYFDPDTGKLYFDPKDVAAAGLKSPPLFSNGDETVTRSSATIPVALESVTKQVTTEYAHDKLFLDPAVEKEYKSFLEKPAPKKLK